MRALVKVLIIGSIVVIALGYLVIWMTKLKQTERLTLCKSNLRHFGVCLHSYHDVYRHFPQAWVPNDALPLEKKLGLMFRLFPFIESRMDLAGKFPDDKKAWDEGENRYLAEHPSPIYCPVNPNMRNVFPLNHYVGLAGVGQGAAFLPKDDPTIGVFGYHRQLTIAEVTDGTSTTLAFIETATDNGPWLAAGSASLRALDNPPYLGDGATFSSNHRKGFWSRTPLINACFLDATARSFSYAMDPKVFEALVTVAGGEKIPSLEDW